MALPPLATAFPIPVPYALPPAIGTGGKMAQPDGHWQEHYGGAGIDVGAVSGMMVPRPPIPPRIEPINRLASSAEPELAFPTPVAIASPFCELALATPVETALPFTEFELAIPFATALPLTAFELAIPFDTAFPLTAYELAIPLETALPLTAAELAIPLELAFPLIA